MGLALDVGYASVLTAAAPWLAWRAARTGRYHEGWSQRLLGQVPLVAAGKSSVWLHGVSLGEVQLLRPLVEHFAADSSGRPVVLSTSTMTGMEVARKTLPHIAACYFPLDFSWAVNRAMQRLNPALIVLGELEVWPHLIAAAARHGVPIAVVNGRLSDRSFESYRRFGWLLRKTFRRLALVAAQDDQTAERFRLLGVDPQKVHVAGSLKFDNVNADRQHVEVQKRASMVGLNDQHRVLVVGSTQEPEERAAVAAVKQLLPRFPQLKLIVVPRHPERFDEVFRLLQEGQLKVLRRSALSSTTLSRSSPAENHSLADWQVLLVDSVGELKWWWGMAELALVGGSFGSRGGQNMLEPAAYGAKVAFGPNVSNFRAIVSALLEKEAVWQIPSLDALPAWIDDQLSRPEEGRAHAERAMALIGSHQGATARTCDLLDTLLKPRSS